MFTVQTQGGSRFAPLPWANFGRPYRALRGTSGLLPLDFTDSLEDFPWMDVVRNESGVTDAQHPTRLSGMGASRLQVFGGAVSPRRRDERVLVAFDLSFGCTPMGTVSNPSGLETPL
jgi:hypothetical protein